MGDFSVWSGLPRNRTELFIEPKEIMLEGVETAPHPVLRIHRKSLLARKQPFERQSKDKSSHWGIGN